MPLEQKKAGESTLFNLKEALASKKESKESNKQIGIYFGSNNKLLSSISRNTYDSTKLLQLNNKVLMDFTTQMTKTLIGLAPKKDPFKRKDPNDRLVKELNDIEGLLLEANKPKKKGAGWLALFGGLLAAGGLIGYLMTGKTEFLNNIWKGLYKYSPARILTGLLDKGLTGVTKGVFKMFSKGSKEVADLGKIAKTGGKAGHDAIKQLEKMSKLGGKVGKNALKELHDVTKVGGAIGKHAGGIIGKMGGKEAAKVAGKVAGKTFLKKIPFVGAAFGLWFGIDRIKKGDWVGGALEIVSGVSSLVPGVGVPLGIAIDAFLLMRDFMGTKKVDSMIGGVAKKAVKVAAGFAFKNLPGLGLIFGIIESVSKFKKGDIKGGMKDLARGVATTIPGGGFVFDIAFDLINKLIKSKKPEADTGGADVVNVNGDVDGRDDGEGKPLGSNIKVPIPPKKSFKFKAGEILKGVPQLFEKGKKKAYQFATRVLTGYTPEAPGLRLKHGVDKSGLQPAVWNNLLGMAAEYKELTGRDIHINELYRSKEEQERLHAIDPKRAPAWSPNSVHYKGVAIDMNTPNAEELSITDSVKYPGKNLMEAWGFWRPGLNWSFPETWHVESEATKPWRQNKQIPIGDTVARSTAEKGEGPALSKQSVPLSVNNNMPTTQIPNRTVASAYSNKNKLDLSDDTISALAKSIKEAYQSAMPKTVQNRTNIQTNARG